MSFSEEIWLLLIGAGIGLVSGIIGAVVQHYLSIRVDREKRKWEEREALRTRLLAGARARAELERLEIYENMRRFEDTILIPHDEYWAVEAPTLEEWFRSLTKEERAFFLRLFSDLFPELVGLENESSD